MSRRTEQRAAIFGQLQKSSGTLSAQELHERLDGVGLATVYRNLNRLAEEGLADAIRRPNGEVAFRICGAGHHHHLTCSKCGTVVEVHDCKVDRWSQELAKRYGFSAVEHQTELVGVCNECGEPAIV